MLKLQYTDGSQKGVWLIEPKQKLGRDRKNDLVLTAEDVGDFHAEVHVQGETLRLEPLAGHACQVNGAPIAGATPIRLGDRIHLGSVELEVMDPRQQKAAPKTTATAPAAASGGGWVLLSQTAGGGASKRWPIHGSMIIGRAADCDISIAYDRMSRKHAEFKVSAGVLTLRDLGSANGTFVNDKPVTEEVRIKAGDKVRFDMLAFSIQGPQDDSNKTVVRPAIDLAALQQAQAGSRPAAKTAARSPARASAAGRPDASRRPTGAAAVAPVSADAPAGSPVPLILGGGVVVILAAAALWFFFA